MDDIIVLLLYIYNTGRTQSNKDEHPTFCVELLDTRNNTRGGGAMVATKHTPNTTNQRMLPAVLPY